MVALSLMMPVAAASSNFPDDGERGWASSNAWVSWAIAGGAITISSLVCCGISCSLWMSCVACLGRLFRPTADADPINGDYVLVSDRDLDGTPGLDPEELPFSNGVA